MQASHRIIGKAETSHSENGQAPREARQPEEQAKLCPKTILVGAPLLLPMTPGGCSLDCEHGVLHLIDTTAGEWVLLLLSSPPPDKFLTVVNSLPLQCSTQSKKQMCFIGSF